MSIKSDRSVVMYRGKVWVLRDMHKQKLRVSESNEEDTWSNKNQHEGCRIRTNEEMC